MWDLWASVDLDCKTDLQLHQLFRRVLHRRFRCEAPEMLPGLRDLTQLPISTRVIR